MCKLARRRKDVIKIELFEKENKYENCVLEMEDRGIIQIVCENVDKKKDFIELVTGTRVEKGLCVLGDVDTKHHLKEYKKKVDLVDIEKVNSTLNVKSYLVFYTMVTGVYHNQTIEEMTQLFQRIDMEKILDKTLNDLSRLEKIKVRCLAAYLKQITCLIGKDLLEDLEPEQKQNVISFLEEYFRKKHCLCLLVEKHQIQAEENVDAVFKI